MGILGTDIFAGSGDLGASWTVVTGLEMPQQVSGVAQPKTVAVVAQALYTGASWPDNQYAQVKVIALNSTNGRVAGVILRGTTAARTGYQISVDGPLGAAAVVKIQRYNAGASTALSTIVTTVNTTDTLKGTIVGDTVTSYINGVVIDSVVDVTPILSGTAGIVLFTSVGITTDARLDTWEGGDYGTAITGLRPAICL